MKGSKGIIMPSAGGGGKQQKRRKTAIVGKLLLFIFFTSTIWGLIRSALHAVQERQWSQMIILFFTLLLLVLIAILWVRGILARREEYRRRLLDKGKQVQLRDALLYALSFSRDIYRTIPSDRKHLVKYSLILIGLPFFIMSLNVVWTGISYLLLYILMALAGFNLLIWLVASEREEKERLKIELETARQMQMALLPSRPPQIAGIDVAGLCIPARSVGGDHYDFVWLGPERKNLGIAVVDVSGKGVDALLTAVYTSGAFVSETRHESGVGQVMANLNQALLSRHDPRHFVSFFFMVVDPAARRLQYINAGQSRPLLYRAGQISVLLGEGPRFPLGVQSQVDYVPRELELREGDRLLLYTDGVSDAVNPQNEIFGDERLHKAFATSAGSGHSAEETIAAVYRTINEFSFGEEQFDDITLVSLRVFAG